MVKPASLFITRMRLLMSLWMIVATAAVGFAQSLPVESSGGEFVPEIPASYSGSGSFFNRQLGTAFRFNYHNEGYGTQQGVVTLGTMKVFNGDGSTIFLDGQATLSDGFGGGYNAGVGFRKLSDLGFGPDSRRINGLSFWSDGQSTSADNFFNQLGVAAESLGDSFDVRFQGNFPLERTKDGDLMDVQGSGPVFAGDALLGALQQFQRDTALTVVDLEGAKRILDLEAWGFLGGYHLTGSGQDASGYRAGVRGYAIPDVAVSLQVTDDDIYHTNVMFGITWFVGRTHRGNQPCGTLLDRFREPVLRNDFIATTQELIDNPINPLSDAVTNEQFVFVHVDSSAPGGGDGSFENPYNNLTDAETGSDEDNIVFVHSGSTLSDNFATKNGQRVLGEGLDPNGVFIDHTVNSAEQGIVSLPETSPGSQDVAAPTITLPGAGTVFDIGNSTSVEVNNFVINGGTTAVSANQADSPQLANLQINDPNGDGIIFTDVVGSSLIENSVAVNRAGGRGIFVDGGSGVLGANAMITNSTGYAIEIGNRAGGSVTVGEIEQTLGGDGIFVHDNSGGTITFSSLANVSTTDPNSPAVLLHNNAGATITFQELQATSGASDTFVVNGGGTISVNDPNGTAFIDNTGPGSAVVVRGNADPNGVPVGNPTLTILADITKTNLGHAVDIQDMAGGSVSITGDVTDQVTGLGSGILIENNSAGTFSFAGATKLDTESNNAVTLRNNSGASINFTDLEATATGGDTFVVEGGGTVTVNDPNDTGFITNTGGGTALVVRGDADPNAGLVGNPTVTIANDIENSNGGTTVDIENMAGGGVTITGDVTASNSTGIDISNNSGGTFSFQGINTLDTAGFNAVTLSNNEGASVTFNHLNATATGGNTLSVEGGGTISILDDPNNAGLIENTGGGTAVRVRGNAFATATGDPNMSIGIDIMNSGGGMSVDIQDMEGGGITFAGLVNDNGGGINIQDNSGGTFLFTDTVMVGTGSNDAVSLMNNSGATISFNGLDITASLAVKGFSATGGGNLTITNTNPTMISSVMGTALELDGMSISAAGVTFDQVDVFNGENDGIILKDLTGTGLVTVGTNADPNTSGTLTINDPNAIGIRVDNVDNLAVDDITIDSDGYGINVTGQGAGSSASFTDLSVDVTDQDGVRIDGNTDGTVVFNTLDVTSTGAGNAVVLQNNTGGTTTFNNSVTLDSTGTGDGLVVQSNGSASTVTFGGSSQLDIDTTSGDGIVLNGPGTVNINGTGNTIDTTSGVGIRTTNVGDATINNTTINTTGSNAVDITHNDAAATSLTLNNVTVASAGNDGVNVFANGSGEFDLLMDTLDISGVGQRGIFFDTGASADRVDLTITDSTVTVGDNEAFLATLDNSNTADVRFLIEDNQFSNNSGTAGNDAAAVDIQVNSGLTLSATIGNGPNDPNNPPPPPIGDNNRFVNTSADGDAFLISNDNSGGTINLDLRDNTAQSNDLEFDLISTAGSTFNLVDATDTLNGNNNDGTVTDNGGVFNDILPPLLMPTP